jgi:hypothetical protein
MKPTNTSLQILRQENPDSVTLKQTAKGGFYWDVKAYGILSTKKGINALADRLADADKALTARFGGVNKDKDEEIADLKQRLEAAELREAKLTDAIEQGEVSATENMESRAQ